MGFECLSCANKKYGKSQMHELVYIRVYASFNTIINFSEISRVYNSIKSNASFVLPTHLIYIFQGTRAIEGLFLDRWLTTKSFKEMNRLRLLKIHNPRRKLFLEDHLPRDFEFSSYEYTYLHWDRYPLESLPLNFHAKNLVELLLRNSNIKQLWRGSKVLLLLFSYSLILY